MGLGVTAREAVGQPWEGQAICGCSFLSPQCAPSYSRGIRGDPQLGGKTAFGEQVNHGRRGVRPQATPSEQSQQLLPAWGGYAIWGGLGPWVILGDPLRWLCLGQPQSEGWGAASFRTSPPPLPPVFKSTDLKQPACGKNIFYYISKKVCTTAKGGPPRTNPPGLGHPSPHRPICGLTPPPKPALELGFSLLPCP